MGHFFYHLEAPLDALPTGAQVRAANFAGFPGLVRRLGGDPRDVLERHGVDAGSIRDPDHFIECQSMVDIFEYCSASFDEPLFGFRLAELQEADVFGCAVALSRSAPTVRGAIQSLIEYMPIIHSPTMELELVEANDTAEWRWGVQTDLGQNAQANFQGALLTSKLLRQIAGPTFRPHHVTLTTKVRPKDLPGVEEHMDCAFHHGDVNSIAFPAHILDQPVPSANRLLFRLISGYLDSVKSASRTTAVERVQDYVRGALPSGSCSIERCAAKFGISVRTLQAQLAEQGVRFSDVLEKQRVELAKAYLKQDAMTLDEVASLLGYAEQTSFGRAFKRWTGLTPQRYRAALGANFN